jgi:hypothetical protein
LAAIAASAVVAAAAEPFRPNLGPDVERVTVRCGAVTVLLRQASQWTPGRIDFQGTPLTTERSAYGTVVSFPGVGFIGTAHLENEPETLESLAFVLDGQPIADPGAELVARHSFRFERVSRIRQFRLRGVVEVKEDRLFESATVSTDQAVPLKVVYHFMHAWSPSVSAFVAGRDGEDGDRWWRGDLGDGPEEARRFHVDAAVDWIAVYEPASGLFAVSRLLEAPGTGSPRSMIWNVPGSYRKYYLKCFAEETVPAGFQGTWRMVTGFGKGEPASWEEASVALARDLAPGAGP